MKVYLVGGAVRDRLLNIPVHERDWVVVGATPEDLLKQKYRQVGRDFPVFLHPNTQEEYALARVERKSAPGYYGFDCDFSATVTLEEDLARRDLTINAIAMDEQGTIIDPYGGQYDLHHKILRHVSPAFIEDPVRVLRVARFVARFHYLGFKLANETRELMYLMVKRGELAHLVAERVWQEWQKSLGEKNPELFIRTLRDCDALRVVFPELNDLFGVPNAHSYSTQTDTGVHALASLTKAARLSSDSVIRFSALLPGLGKRLTPMAQWPYHDNYETQSVSLINNLCLRLRIPNEYRALALSVARFHEKIHQLNQLSAEAIVTILERADAFRRSQLFYSLLTASWADAGTIDYEPVRLWNYIFAECVKITAKILVAQGFEGNAIKDELHNRRIACVELILNSWEHNEK